MQHLKKLLDLMRQRQFSLALYTLMVIIIFISTYPKVGAYAWA